jgi:hypothetical protein
MNLSSLAYLGDGLLGDFGVDSGLDVAGHSIILILLPRITAHHQYNKITICSELNFALLLK